jgi:cysteine-S-conjugate beta-lyase
MPYDFDRVIDRHSTNSNKWRRYPADVLPLWVADMDFPSPEPVVRALRERVDHGVYGYGFDGPEFAEVFVDRVQKRYGWKISPEALVLIPGVIPGFNVACHALTQPGDGLLMQLPVYPPIHRCPGNHGLTRDEVPLGREPDGRYVVDLDAFRAAIHARTRAFLLCNPHNPVGRVWSRDQLTAIADLCDRRGVPVLVDEIHAPLVLPGARHVPFHTLDHPAARRAVVFTSASKGWNIPGLKCGVAVAGDQRAAAILDQRWDALLGSHLGVHASIAALRNARPWLDAVVRQIEANTRLLGTLLPEHLPGARYRPPEASFLAWIDCREMELGDDPAAEFLARGKVALSSGPDFGTEGLGFARLNIGTSPELIGEAVRRMALAVNG